MQIETLPHGTQVFLSNVHRFGTDALLLAQFCTIKRAQSVADFGTGCGILALHLQDAGHTGPCYAIDIAPDAIALVQQGVNAANASNITPLCTDLTTWRSEKVLDAIVCNPPYFTAGAQSANETRATARHEGACTIEIVCVAASKNLKMGGKLFLCNRPDRLTDTLCAMRQAHIEPKRLQFVAQSETHAPWLFLVEGQKQRAPGLQVLPPYLLQGKTTIF